ncbi:hypothetical protein J4E83_005883 [Alternaria metachromatica]|uniref:uncharacterized protein n=1 Tax=Alternaria metachromatica TaxID=283354 RepID=UPI0020C2D9EF|nr:uncharacterized protein J4E83_005883 [Alternaria metachromatica]KAI4618932.1 hypothetical protein J4E83_005883 [Alternaria metachromatica]
MTWTPTWTSEEENELKELFKRSEGREAKLKELVTPDSRKWNWPEEALNIVKEARKDSTDHYKLVTRDLLKLYTWPSEEMTRPDIFIDGEENFKMFDRKETWVEDEGFFLFKTDYTFSDRWDKESMEVTILVPQEMKQGHEAPVMWLFHGGGYCTGAADFYPWYSKTAIAKAKKRGAIIIAPDYPLAPEANYEDIVKSMRDFLDWYKEDGCFEPRYTEWTKWLYSRTPGQKYSIDKDRVYVEGESAGGQAAVTAMWLNATKGGPNLPIKVALLRYPMIAHYKRDWDKSADKKENKGKNQYMGQWFTETEVKERAKDVGAVIRELEKRGVVPTCSERWPSQGMAFAFILSMAQTWKDLLRRKHGDCSLADPTNTNYMDGLERAKHTSKDVEPDFLPPIHIFHGWDDPNCDVKDTIKFRDTLRDSELYGDRFKEDNMLFMSIVKSLQTRPTWNSETEKVDRGPSEKVGHGFDYWLDEDKEQFLKDAYTWVCKRWDAKP